MRPAVRDSARAHEPDRYLAALLAPRGARDGLITLAAFQGEVARIPLTTTEPALGTIRLQWWRDALCAELSSGLTGHPVADALNGLMRDQDLPRATFDTMIDAQSVLFNAEPFSDEAALASFLDETEGAAFRLAMRVLGVPQTERSVLLSRTAGLAYGLARLLYSRGGALLPSSRSAAANADAARDHLRIACGLLPSASPAMHTAVLPLALVEPYLRAFEEADRVPATGRALLTPLGRIWRLWRAARLGRW